jgi:5-methyltetrahydropteroyltriglutamate--homocysteine methyltransferase
MSEHERRIRTTHAGSLPRPPHLRKLLAAGFAGQGAGEAAAELAAASTAATRAAVKRQLDTGIDVINNGEQGRESFFTYVQHRMSGFGGESDRAIMRDTMTYPGYRERMVRASRAEDAINLLAAPRAIGEVRYTRPELLHAECAELAAILDDLGAAPGDAFMSSPSPGIIAAAMTNDHYPSLADYVDALAEALRVEYETIAEAGFTLQIDAPDLALERHTSFADRPLGAFLDFVRMVVAAINKALAKVPRERVRLHVCWGNYEGPHHLDVPLEDIFEEIVKIDAGALMLSMANPRHAHEYRLFERRRLPEHMKLIVGVIDTTTNYIEHPLAVADRLELAARALGDPSRILAGTDCGFETSSGVSFVAEDVAWAKLGSLCEGAEIASRKLLG